MAVALTDDVLEGGAGNDVYVVDDVADVVVELASEGTDRVDASVTVTAAANVEDLTLTGSADVDATGNSLSNVLTGNSGDNVLTGGAGADVLEGGVGTDSLYGGADADRFVYRDLSDFSASPDLEAIFDFATLDMDTIDLSALDADSASSGDQSFDFIGASAFSSSAGELRMETVSGGLQVQGDIDGDGITDFAIMVMAVSSLAVADFVI